MLTPNGFPAWCWLLGHIPLFYCCFSFVLVVLCHIWYQSKHRSVWSIPQSIQNWENHPKKKKKTITAVSFTTRKLSLSFPYLVPKSCPIVVLTIRRPDIQANQRLQSKNPQSSLQIPCDHKDKEKRNKSAAIVPHYHQQATTFRFGWILSRQLLRMPPPPPLWTATSTGPHHHLCYTPPRFQFCPVSRCCNLISLRRSDLKR